MTLVVLRHGESEWNASDRFAGWVDVGLTATGRDEARTAGRQLRAASLVPDVVHTSRLARAVDTADLVVAGCGGPASAGLRTELLNERHYGTLQGMRRADAVARYGAGPVARWRRGIDGRPPRDAEGRGESLADVRARLEPYVASTLLPQLAAGRTVLVVSHGNTIRMLRRLVEGLSDEQACALEVPTGQPVVVQAQRPASYSSI
ncbi:2,3-bisphosphoglycerate-dependent phosphoglycerate mutase [Nocardioides sp. NPDC058538]|uniref:2,3-bisphosphoglycerate-dependent phosphoglycerate mutase n=1 Tax=Nocardioides sp. NPDC058538 TaxID=3346542 RepID=UPI00365D4245